MQIIRADGFLGLFRGMVPTLAREVPGYFFFFGGYEMSRYLLTPKGKTADDIGKMHSVHSVTSNRTQFTQFKSMRNILSSFFTFHTRCFQHY